MTLKELSIQIVFGEKYTCDLLQGYLYLDKSRNLQLFTLNKVNYENFIITFNELMAADWYIFEEANLELDFEEL